MNGISGMYYRAYLSYPSVLLAPHDEEHHRNLSGFFDISLETQKEPCVGKKQT